MQKSIIFIIIIMLLIGFSIGYSVPFSEEQQVDNFDGGSCETDGHLTDTDIKTEINQNKAS